MTSSAVAPRRNHRIWRANGLALDMARAAATIHMAPKRPLDQYDRSTLRQASMWLRQVIKMLRAITEIENFNRIGDYYDTNHRDFEVVLLIVNYFTQLKHDNYQDALKMAGQVTNTIVDLEADRPVGQESLVVAGEVLTKISHHVGRYG